MAAATSQKEFNNQSIRVTQIIKLYIKINIIRYHFYFLFLFQFNQSSTTFFSSSFNLSPSFSHHSFIFFNLIYLFFHISSDIAYYFLFLFNLILTIIIILIFGFVVKHLLTCEVLFFAP